MAPVSQELEPPKIPGRFIWPSILAGGGFDLFGSLGLLLGVCAGLMPSRTLILLTSAACSGSFGLHYLGFGSATGVAMGAISLVQSLAAARFGGTTQPASLKAVFCLSLLVALALVVVTWNGWPSLCAGAGTLCATFARQQADASAMRRLFVCASTCWAGHNLQWARSSRSAVTASRSQPSSRQSGASGTSGQA
ncbi:YgjV family protein [Methylobacterium sp. P31]